mmetsp:Transcript_9015/g.12079  ORF Transcript_9015/g.12079 Transcript_9015/m.12079 type:complete len:325 (-) Transcript_9015:51-1025(-)
MSCSQCQTEYRYDGFFFACDCPGWTNQQSQSQRSTTTSTSSLEEEEPEEPPSEPSSDDGASSLENLLFGHHNHDHRNDFFLERHSLADDDPIHHLHEPHHHHDSPMLFDHDQQSSPSSPYESSPRGTSPELEGIFPADDNLLRANSPSNSSSHSDHLMTFSGGGGVGENENNSPPPIDVGSQTVQGKYHRSEGDNYLRNGLQEVERALRSYFEGSPVFPQHAYNRAKQLFEVSFLLQAQQKIGSVAFYNPRLSQNGRGNRKRFARRKTFVITAIIVALKEFGLRRDSDKKTVAELSRTVAGTAKVGLASVKSCCTTLSLDIKFR